MTTIAWDGRELAADRGSWSGYVKSRVRKIFKREDRNGRPVLVAVCGDGGWAMAWLEWMYGTGAHPGPYPDKDAKLSMNIALVVDSRRRVWKHTANLQVMRALGRLHATGAGGEFALGAMAAGATARRAVLLTAKHSDCSAFGVDVVRF